MKLFEGVNTIYTTREIADYCGVSVQTINKHIRNFTEIELETFVYFLKPNETKNKRITEKGFQYFKSYYSVNSSFKSSVNDFCDNSIIETLQNQIKSKDEQIKVLNEQLQNSNNIINSLLEQNKNYQVLLQGQQVLSLPKKSILKRLFGKV